MKRPGREAVGSLFWLAVGVCFGVGAILLKPGTLRNPGPGLLPLLMSVFLVAMSGWVLIKGLSAREGHTRGIEWKAQAFVVASLFLYGWLLNFLGFLLATFLLMFSLFGLLCEGKKNWAKVSLWAMTTAILGWLVFVVALKVPLPKGSLMVLGG